jgi:hypothetical protein
MTIQDQEHIKQKAYKEAMRYIANAKDYLQKAGMDGGIYKDKKYVRTACGKAYNGVLAALDALADIKRVKVSKDSRKSIGFYRDLLCHNDKLQTYLDTVYKNLHLSGYYDGNLDSAVIKSGFKYAKELISLVRPAGVA